jgi:hypothetical protein
MFYHIDILAPTSLDCGLTGDLRIVGSEDDNAVRWFSTSNPLVEGMNQVFTLNSCP